MKNWKTTAAGCASAAIYAIISAIQTGKLEPKDIAIAAAIAALGVAAKDFDVTGGTKKQ